MSREELRGNRPGREQSRVEGRVGFTAVPGRRKIPSRRSFFLAARTFLKIKPVQSVTSNLNNSNVKKCLKNILYIIILFIVYSYYESRERTSGKCFKTNPIFKRYIKRIIEIRTVANLGLFRFLVFVVSLSGTAVVKVSVLPLTILNFLLGYTILRTVVCI